MTRLAPPIRWKKRLRGWVGFIGTSRAPTVSVRRGLYQCSSPHRAIVVFDGVGSWWHAPNIDAAKAWAERQLVRQRTPAAPPPVEYTFLHRDGTVDRRGVLDRARQWHLELPPRDGSLLVLSDEHDDVALRSLNAPLPVVTKTFHRHPWRRDLENRVTGARERLEIFLYVEEGVEPAVERRVADDELLDLARARGLVR